MIPHTHTVTLRMRRSFLPNYSLYFYIAFLSLYAIVQTITCINRCPFHLTCLMYVWMKYFLTKSLIIECPSSNAIKDAERRIHVQKKIFRFFCFHFKQKVIKSSYLWALLCSENTHCSHCKIFFIVFFHHLIAKKG